MKKRYQVRIWTTRGSFQLMTTAKSPRQAVAFAKFRLRERGVFDFGETEVTEV